MRTALAVMTVICESKVWHLEPKTPDANFMRGEIVEYFQLSVLYYSGQM